MTTLGCASGGLGRLRRFVLLSAGVLAAAPSGAAATGLVGGQEAEIARRLSQMSQTSTSEVLRAIRESNMSRAEARNQLRLLGFDPFLADPYFAAIGSGRQVAEGLLDESALAAFRGLGLVGDTTVADLSRPALADSLGELEAEGPQVFGHRVFRQSTSRFEPLLTGPVGDDYVLGPGDGITLIVTGNVEVVREQLVVSREGFLVIPDVGQVAVVGLTMEELRERLFTRLSRVYSGISRGTDADTFFSISITRLRTIQVRVLGEVVRPGSYQLSSVATVLEALYFAGGPTDQGTYRRVLLRRGREVPREVDLYPYLTSGSLSEDHRLQSGDVVYVPEAGRQATVSGEVRRPAIFEMAEGEGLKDLLQFAGGLLPSAATGRAAVERILPAADRRPGVERIMVDAPLAAVLEGTETFDVLPGDMVHVSPVGELLGRSVEIVGAVWRPGVYEFRPGMTVASLVEQAGAYPDAMTEQVRVLRLIPETGKRVGVPSAPQLELADQDFVEVFSGSTLAVPDSITVFGLVRSPGRYIHFEGMLAGDAILTAGGFSVGATASIAEVVMPSEDGRVDSKLVRLREPISGLSPAGGGNHDALDAGGDAQDGPLPEAAVPLRPGAEVYVRGLLEQDWHGHVVLRGAFQQPGTYAILKQDERISEVVGRAGGLANDAYANSFRLSRNGAYVGVDFSELSNNPITESDPPVIEGDSLFVDPIDQTVFVAGAVNFPSRVVFDPRLDVDEMLSQAGGPTSDADLDHLSVRYADGSRLTTRKVLGLFRIYPDIESGSEVFVPLKVQEPGINWSGSINTALTATTAITTLWFLIRDIRMN